MMHSAMRLGLTLGFAITASGCQTSDIFTPKSDYPTDPWVKGYANPDDCLGGEALAALNIPLPDYPRRAFNSGRQGWTIVRLDINEAGLTENVAIERSVPGGDFSSASLKAVEGWKFQPPKNGALQSCRILFRYRLGMVTLGS